MNREARDRDKKMAADPDALDRLLVKVCLDAHHQPPGELWLDLAAKDAPALLPLPADWNLAKDRSLLLRNMIAHFFVEL